MPGGTTANVGLATMVGKSAAGRTRSTVTVPASSSATRPTSSSEPPASVLARTDDVEHEGHERRRRGRVDEPQPAADDVARPASGVPSEKVRSGRSWKTMRRPSSSMRHDSARAGWSSRSSSNAVSDSNSWAMTAALPASPVAAGSSVDGVPMQDARLGRGRPRRSTGLQQAVSRDATATTAASDGTVGRRTAGVYGRVAGTALRRPTAGLAGGRAGRRAGNEASRTTPPGERCLNREASAGITTRSVVVVRPAARESSRNGRSGAPRYDGCVTLRLRNTLTRSVEPVEPLAPGRVRMYTCGPTVYRYAHVGNLRSYLLADLIRRVLLYHGLDVLHVKNITDVGHLRDERFDRGEDRMLVQAGLETRRAPRSPTPTRPRSTPTRRRSTSCPPTSSRGPPSTSPRCSSWPRRWSTPATPTCRRRRQRLLRRRVVPGLRAAVGQLARRPAGRPSRRGRAGQARPGRLRAVEGGRRGPRPEVADAALGRGLPGLAPRVLGDGPALPGRPVRPPHRRHRQRLPPPRGRDRPVGAARRRAAGDAVGPRRAPAHVRPEDGQVGGQLPARHRARRARASTRWPSATWS